MEQIVQDEMKSKLDDIATSIAELKSQKVVIAFRAYCAKNFPSDYVTHKSENPGMVAWEGFFLIVIYLSIFSYLENG